jgi:glycosyltransferase involved in cell wall biosynthesis
MSINNSPLVSVLMTAYNREKYIGEAIESVLSSTYTNFELIIVDDGSRDSTVEIAHRYTILDQRITLFVNESNLGDYPNRNKAASFAKGKYLKYLDSDDFMYPHCLEVMVSSMEKFPGAAFGVSAVSVKDRCYPLLLTPAEAYKEHFLLYGHFDRAPGSVIINQSIFNKVGGFSGKKWIGDSELWFKLAMLYPIVKFPRDLVWDRIHGDQEKSIETSRNNIKVSTQMRKDLMNEMLNHNNCPLDQQEKQRLLALVNGSLIKKIVRKIYNP